MRKLDICTWKKKRRKFILNTIIERDNLLRRMASLQQQNKRLEERSSNLHSNVFGDMDVLKSSVQKKEQLLKQKEAPVVAQVQPYKPLETRVEEVNKKDLDKGKQKIVGNQINEPHPPKKPTSFLRSKLDLDLERDKKEKEDLTKEPEKVEHEAQAAETRRKI